MATVAGLIAATGFAATSDGAPVPVTSSNWELRLPQGAFERRLLNDCLMSSRYGFQVEFTAGSPADHVFQGVGITTVGSFDLAAGNVSVTSNSPAFRVDNYNVHSGAIIVGWLGLKTVGRGAVVTGRIQRTRTIFARVGPRRPLLRIKRLTTESGPFLRKGKEVPDTFVIAMDGRATVLPALAREATRIRCRGPHIVTSRPIRAGSPFGLVRLQLRPDVATGVGGTVDVKKIEANLSSDTDLTPVVTPSSLHVDLPADLRTPLGCEASYNCGPAIGSQLPIGGGFTIALGDRTVTVTDLSLAYVDVNGRSTPTVSGTVDGTPMVVFRDINASDEFDAHCATALNVFRCEVGAAAIEAHFPKTAPP